MSNGYTRMKQATMDVYNFPCGFDQRSMVLLHSQVMSSFICRINKTSYD